MAAPERQAAEPLGKALRQGPQLRPVRNTPREPASFVCHLSPSAAFPMAAHSYPGPDPWAWEEEVVAAAAAAAAAVVVASL